jgi:16S rRNA (uracil1498-N3)-methyltransferase
MRFFCRVLANTCVLTGAEAYHCIKVMRGKVGDPVEVLNGNGEIVSGKIIDIKKDEVVIETNQVSGKLPENPNKLSIAVCPPKNPSRLEWFIEKATEIGIEHIFPIVSQRTERANIKHDRLEQIIISAGKQSGQVYFPVLHPVQSLKEFYGKLNVLYASRFIAHCENEKLHLKDAYKKNEKSILLIGPEGDFTKDEIEIAVNNNYIPVSLGNSILRVETAGVVACSIINSINFEK